MTNESHQESLEESVCSDELNTSEGSSDTLTKINSLNPIDWRLHPRIEKDIRQLNNVKSNPNNPFGKAGPMAVAKGQQLSLKVTVTDPELAQVVLSRAFAGNDNSRIPGMIIDEIGYGTETNQKRLMAQELRKLADDLEYGHGE